MNDAPVVRETAPHEYLVRLREGDDLIEIRLHASPAVLTRIGGADTNERLIVDATLSYLIARQRADDLPDRLDLEDIAAAYEGYIDTIKGQVMQP
jgi:hypothetical protein